MAFASGAGTSPSPSPQDGHLIFNGGISCLDTGFNTNNAFSGTFTRQNAGPFSGSSVSGNLIGGSGASSLADIPDIEAAVVADSSAGKFNAVADLDSLTSQSGNLRNLSFGGTYLIQDPVLGYGSATLPAFMFDITTNSTNPQPASFYMIGPQHLVLIGTQSGLYSGVSFLDH
jgi:hypothetical protein